MVWYLLGWPCHPTRTYTSPVLSRGFCCLASNWVSVWMGQIEQAWSSSSPQLENLYARHAQCWTGVVQASQNSTDSVFHHFPEHHRHTTLPSHQPSQPEPQLHQTKHVQYNRTSLPERPELGRVFSVTDFPNLVFWVCCAAYCWLICHITEQGSDDSNAVERS